MKKKVRKAKAPLASDGKQSPPKRRISNAEINEAHRVFWDTHMLRRQIKNNPHLTTEMRNQLWRRRPQNISDAIKAPRLKRELAVSAELEARRDRGLATIRKKQFSDDVLQRNRRIHDRRQLGKSVATIAKVHEMSVSQVRRVLKKPRP